MDFRTDPMFGNVSSALEQSRGLPQGLLSALVGVESGGNSNATSPAGAHGLTQFMPATAQQYNVNTNDPVDSMRGTADYLQDLIHKYNGNVPAALAHYNGGAHNAQYQVDGTVPSPQQVSPQNFETNQKYVNKIMSKLPQGAPASTDAAPALQPSDVTNMVAGILQKGGSTLDAISALKSNPQTADLVQEGLSKGMTYKDIIKTIGGSGATSTLDARDNVDGQNILTNAGHVAVDSAKELAGGAQQLAARATGNDAQLQQLQQQQAAREADPTYQAEHNTVGGMIGGGVVKALPYIAGSALAPEATIPMLLANGAAGAASGALKPTTGDGQIIPNMLTEGALGAGGAAAGALASKGIGALAGKVLGDGQSATEFAARKAAADAAGLPSNAATLSGPESFWRQTADAMPQNGSVQAFQAKADQALATKVGEGLGLKGYTGAIDHEMLQAAEPGIKAGLDNAATVNVVLPQSLKADLTSMVSGASNPLTEGIATNSTVKQAVANLLKAVDNGAPVAGKSLQDLNTELKALTQAVTGVSPSEKALAGKLVGKINSTLTGAMTKDQAAAYQLANNQYTHLKAVENMVKSSGDSGVVTPRQMINAVKTGRFKNAFFDGVAPYQDLANTAQDMYGPAGGKGLGSLIGGQLGHATGDLGIYAALSHPHAIPLLLAKALGSKALGALASSENPTVARLLAGGSGGVDPTVASYISKALAGTGAAAATN